MSIPRIGLVGTTLLLALGALAGCVDDHSMQSTEGTPEDTPASPQGTGTATVLVTDPEGGPLFNASVSVLDEWNRRYLPAEFTGADGTVTIRGAPNWLRISVTHGLGYRQSESFRMEPGGSVRIAVTIDPRDLVSVAMLPARIPAASVSGDRTELTVQLTLVADSSMGFQPSSYGSPSATPMVRVGDCWTWLEPGETQPACQYAAPANVATVSLRYQPGAVAWSGVTAQRSALLLLDQGTRSAHYDPDRVRWFAAGRMLQRIAAQATPGGTPQLTFAGFTSTAGGSFVPLQLPAPAWNELDPAGAFLAEPVQQRTTLNSLQSMGGGLAPLVPALQAATDLMATSAPAGSRALVILTGGADAVSGTIEQQDQALATRVAPAQRAAGIRTLLVAGQLPEASPERARLAQMAALLDAPLIFSGYPANWRPEFNPFDGLHTAMALAADITGGAALPTLEAAFRLRTDAARPFVSGALLEGTVYIESDLCPMGCAEIPLAFAARIP
jgi:hypothetical protein